jgi:hypothetical protein
MLDAAFRVTVLDVVVEPEHAPRCTSVYGHTDAHT